jgi:hypothetical protein
MAARAPGRELDLTDELAPLTGLESDEEGGVVVAFGEDDSGQEFDGGGERFAPDVRQLPGVTRRRAVRVPGCR